jgi:hypothetical protein
MTQSGYVRVSFNIVRLSIYTKRIQVILCILKPEDYNYELVF